MKTWEYSLVTMEQTRYNVAGEQFKRKAMATGGIFRNRTSLAFAYTDLTFTGTRKAIYEWHSVKVTWICQAWVRLAMIWH